MKPYPYQQEGAEFLASRKRAALFDGMRCGKTIQAVLAADLAGCNSVLVVCPGLARHVWQQTFEAASFLGRPIVTVYDAKQEIEPDGVTILSMDGSRNEDLHARVMRHEWDVLIIDEQHFLKERSSQRTKQVLSRTGFASRARRIWFLSGTPMLNGPQDLWVTLRTIGAFGGSFVDFLDRYCVWFQGEYGPFVKAIKRSDELRQIIRSCSMRRTWQEVRHQVTKANNLDPIWNTFHLAFEPTIPEDHEWVQYFRRHEENPRAIRDVRRVRDWLRESSSTYSVKKAPYMKPEATKLRRVTGLLKVKPLVDWLLPKLAGNDIDKCVIFFHHSSVGKMTQDYLRPYEAKLLYGGTNPRSRERMLMYFNNRADRRVLVCQDQVGRQAIDLSVARHLIFLEMDWVPENNAQAAMRIQGPNQTRQPMIHVPLIAGSIDDLVTATCARKTQLLKTLLD